MSAYTEVETEFRDFEALKLALQDLKYAFEEGEALAMYGYQGDKRRQTAEIVIRRQRVGPASNDVGFTLQPNGSYKLIVSEYDEDTNFDETIQNKLKQRYSYHAVVRQAKAKGYQVSESKEKGKIKLVLRRWS